MRHHRLDACRVPVGAVRLGRAMLQEVAAALEAGVPLWMIKKRRMQLVNPLISFFKSYLGILASSCSLKVS